MKTIILSAVLAVGSIFNVSAQEVETEYTKYQIIVADKAKDPESVKFRSFEVLNPQSFATRIENKEIKFGITLTVNKKYLILLLNEGKAIPFVTVLNAKNGYGAYTGYSKMCGFINIETEQVIYLNQFELHCNNYHNGE